MRGRGLFSLKTSIILGIALMTMMSCQSSCDLTDPDDDNNNTGRPEVGLSFSYVGEGPNDGYMFSFSYDAHNFDYEPRVTWYFGDGAMSGADKPVHEYRECGIFNVELDASDANGNFATDNEMLVVNAFADCEEESDGDFVITAVVRSSQSSADLTISGGEAPFGIRYRAMGTETWLKPEESGGQVILTPPNPVDGRSANINPPAGTWEVKAKNAASSPIWSNVVSFTVTS